MPVEYADNMLFLEGPDDVHAIGMMLKGLGLTKLRDKKDKTIGPLKLSINSADHNSPELDILHSKSVQKALNDFQGRLANTEEPKNAIGLIIDFDRQVDNRPEQARSRLQGLHDNDDNDLQWIFPASFTDPAGTILKRANDSTPRVGVWLMPDNHNPGMLETFLKDLIPEASKPRAEFASNSAKQAKSEYNAKYKDVHAEKSAVHTFLAWEDEPGNPFGQAFHSNSFDPTLEAAKPFIRWFCKLFDVPLPEHIQ